MATINYIQDSPIDGVSDFMLVTWPDMQNGDVGQPFIRGEFCDRSAQIEGTFGANGTVAIEGCNERIPTNWRTLNDPFSNPISITTPKIEVITELVIQIRPSIIDGDGTTSITVSMLMRKNK